MICYCNYCNKFGCYERQNHITVNATFSSTRDSGSRKKSISATECSIFSALRPLVSPPPPPPLIRSVVSSRRMHRLTDICRPQWIVVGGVSYPSIPHTRSSLRCIHCPTQNRPPSAKNTPRRPPAHMPAVIYSYLIRSAPSYRRYLVTHICSHRSAAIATELVS